MCHVLHCIAMSYVFAIDLSLVIYFYEHLREFSKKEGWSTFDIGFIANI